jgi:1,2-diacylglycerol 3-alpha-glucosyltransferase
VNRLRYLYRFKPDIIHIHNEFGVGFFGMQAAGILNVPMVYTIHTMYDDYLHYVAPSGMTYVLNKTISIYLKQLAKSSSAIIGPSVKVQEFCRRHGVRQKVHIIRNCPDLKAFHPSCARMDKISTLREKFGIQPDSKVLIAVSRVAAEKSLDVLIEYFGKCFTGDSTYEMVIIGSGPALPSLKEQANRLRLNGQVHFTGAVPNEEVPDYCHLADLFLSASLTEIYSISMLEGLASGLPAVIRRDPVNLGQIENGVNGFLFNDVSDFEQRIRGYFAMPTEEREKLKESTLGSVSSYGSAELAAEVADVYRYAQKKFKLRPHNKLTAKIKSLRQIGKHGNQKPTRPD